ncbi:PREDICTED: UPF0505 protein C16orf62 isoform X2 [Nicotiana attenuata]|uniref:UPF0505 protein C16orf62 isoform X2 n=1 Tax=Nicotiana attenuata TaxID=49451 RepID=UPI0009050EDA|nr:PREDICTED: UPF0505 protein C16orf62 isoform X2 [Nicotiana attenuata]
MELKFRHRDYKAEVEIHSFRRIPAETHPLSLQSPSCDQVDVTDYGGDEFFDPLRGNSGKPEDSAKDLGSTAAEITAEPYRDITIKYPGTEWTSYKKVLMQKFPVSKMISVSSLSSSIMKTCKGTEKPSANAHLEELDDPPRFAEEGVKYITLQEYVSRLTELKDEISRAWHVNDRVTSFNLSIKVAKLLSDTSVLQFYPTLFVLATEILDMLGDMVWERIRQKAEYTEDGTLVHLPDNFRATEICAEAKETCYNWFFKVGSIRELLPRIYLELAIFHCWRFLLQKPADNLPRLVMMARGIADPLVSFYCRLYLAHCAQKLPQRDLGHLIISMNDMNTLLMNGAHVASVEKTSGVLSGNRSSKLGLMEPAIEYVTKCLFRESCEVVSRFNSLDEYLNVVDAHIDIALQKHMNSYLDSILDGILERTSDGEIGESELSSLQSILLKLLNHFDNLENMLQLNHFNQILSMMQGSSRTIINLRILSIAIRNTFVRDPTTIQFLFEVSRSLHDSIDLSNIKDKENNRSAHLISRFIHMVDYGSEGERHLAFLVQCRGAFGSMSEVKETIVHSSNLLAIKSRRNDISCIIFVKSCIACSEVTIPSIPSHLKQLNLYLETAEVALMAGLVSHLDGLVDSALRCLNNIDLLEGSRMPKDIDGFQSILCKFCSLIVMIPGDIERGVTSIPRNMFSILSSLSWMLPSMKVKVLCALILTFAALSQKNLLYHSIHDEVMGNDSLFYGDQQYMRELLSFSAVILQSLIDTVLQEPIQAASGNLALDACNAIASSFEACEGASDICSKLVETAKLSLGSDNKYLQSTIKFLNSRELVQGEGLKKQENNLLCESVM